MNTEAFIAARVARPKNFRVTSTYADGKTRVHDVNNMGQAENWAYRERVEIGRDLIERETGKIVRIVDVKIERIQ